MDGIHHKQVLRGKNKYIFKEQKQMKEIQTFFVQKNEQKNNKNSFSYKVVQF